MEQGLESLKTRAMVATSFIWAVIAACALIITVDAGAMSGLFSIIEADGLEADWYAYLYMLFGIVFIASSVAVAFWIFRAHTNMREAGVDGLEFTGGWAIGWYFVPIANLFKPFQAMRELWNTSAGLSDNFGAEAPSLLKAWWICWLISGFVGYAALVPDAASSWALVIDIISLLLTAASAWFLLQIVTRVTQNQATGTVMVQVFE